MNFQIEIKTVEKCMREDITNLNSYKMDAYKGEKLRSELEDLKHKVANGDNNLDSRITQVSKTVDTDVKNKIKASEKSIIGITQLLKEMTARFNMFENRMEDFFKSTPSEAPVKRQEVDQERLRYLGKLSLFTLLRPCMKFHNSTYKMTIEKKCTTLCTEFESLTETVTKRINEVFSDLNRKSTVAEVEEKELKLYGKLDELMESLLKKFVNKEQCK